MRLPGRDRLHDCRLNGLHMEPPGASMNTSEGGSAMWQRTHNDDMGQPCGF